MHYSNSTFKFFIRMSIKATKSKIRNQKKILDTYTQIVLKAQENIEEKIENISNPSQYVSTILQLSNFVVPKKKTVKQEPEKSKIKFLLSNNESIII